MFCNARAKHHKDSYAQEKLEMSGELQLYWLGKREIQARVSGFAAIMSQPTLVRQPKGNLVFVYSIPGGFQAVKP